MRENNYSRFFTASWVFLVIAIIGWIPLVLVKEFSDYYGYRPTGFFPNVESMFSFLGLIVISIPSTIISLILSLCSLKTKKSYIVIIGCVVMIYLIRMEI